MKIGIIGSGGREHAICVSLYSSKNTEKIYCIPGNAGTSELAENISLDINDFKKVYEFLKKLCNQTYQKPEIVTNATKFYKHDYNDYENCNWWPHRDDGYNAIVYFNDECGTNLYAPDQEKELSHEHHEPWIKKGKYQVLKTIEPKFNKLVFFDGLKFPHGMDISNDTYFSKFRYNQVFFFDA